MSAKKIGSIVKVMFFVLCLLSCGLINSSFAEEINILYSGETHSMLYTCSCPKEADGGVARRATLIKKLKQENPNTLLLDSGGFFAGGLLDEYTQNTQLDQERTRISLKAMELMKYDAVAIGDDEFNFGKDFMQDALSKAKIPSLSANIGAEKNGIIKPYITKEISGVKFGIIGLTTNTAQQKAGGMKFNDPVVAVKQAVKELQSQKVNLIVLLSHQGEDEDVKLINSVPEIDILIIGHNRVKEDLSAKIGNTIVLRPSWQGRRLGKAALNIKNNKIVDYKVEDIRLSDQLVDDSEILTVLPRCFSDANCKKEGLIGACADGGTMKASCSFTEANKISFTVITPKECTVCNTEPTVKSLKKQFPGLMVTQLFYPDANAEKLVKELAVEALPVYLFGKEVEREKSFDGLKDKLDLKGDYYMIKPQISGMAYFLNRNKIKGKLDLFVSLYDKNASGVLEAVKEFNPEIHFLAVEQNNKFDAGKGALEIEEDLRSVCIQKYYPQNFWDYMSCRTKNIESSWWDACLPNVNTEKVKNCARSKEGEDLLRKNTSLNKELKVMFGPTYLKDNQEIFGTTGVPVKEELKKILKKL